MVLAIGHSARDTFAMLHRRGVLIEAKPFSIGVRIEHPQALIDRARFGGFAGHPMLGAADYKLVHHASNGRSVYSFCMCPGGRVVAATSEAGCVATNGMSQYSRAEFNANAGIVCGITPEDYPGDALAGVAYQQAWERRAFEAGAAIMPPRCRLSAICWRGGRRACWARWSRRISRAWRWRRWPRACPGSRWRRSRRLWGGLTREIPGFAMHDAVLTGVETRTSSPIRIAAGEEGQSVNTPGLFPAGKGPDMRGDFVGGGGWDPGGGGGGVLFDRGSGGGADDAGGGGWRLRVVGSPHQVTPQPCLCILA